MILHQTDKGRPSLRRYKRPFLPFPKADGVPYALDV